MSAIKVTVDWEKFRTKKDSMSKAETLMIRQLFHEMTEASDYFEEYGTSDMEIAFDAFEQSWIMQSIM